MNICRNSCTQLIAFHNFAWTSTRACARVCSCNSYYFIDELTSELTLQHSLHTCSYPNDRWPMNTLNKIHNFVADISFQRYYYWVLFDFSFTPHSESLGIIRFEKYNGQYLLRIDVVTPSSSLALSYSLVRKLYDFFPIIQPIEKCSWKMQIAAAWNNHLKVWRSMCWITNQFSSIKHIRPVGKAVELNLFQNELIFYSLIVPPHTHTLPDSVVWRTETCTIKLTMDQAKSMKRFIRSRVRMTSSE